MLQQRDINGREPFLAVHPWTSNPAKQWPVTRYRAVIQGIKTALNIPVVLIGGADEQAAAAEAIPSGIPVINLVGRVNLVQLAALLRRARLLLSNDSGPIHLAAALGTATIALFGTTSQAAGPRRWGPWGAGHTVIWKPSMDAISVDEVCAALRTQLTLLAHAL